MTDNGAYYCYCNRWRDNKNAHGGHYDTPMHLTIKALQKYHRELGLHIDMYHLDSGFWHSAHSDGHCDGVTASNWSASEFHWPHTTGADGRVGDGLGQKVSDQGSSIAFVVPCSMWACLINIYDSAP